MEQAQADEVVDAISDLKSAMIKVAFASPRDESAIENVKKTAYPAGLVI